MDVSNSSSSRTTSTAAFTNSTSILTTPTTNTTQFPSSMGTSSTSVRTSSDTIPDTNTTTSTTTTSSPMSTIISTAITTSTSSKSTPTTSTTSSGSTTSKSTTSESTPTTSSTTHTSSTTSAPTTLTDIISFTTTISATSTDSSSHSSTSTTTTTTTTTSSSSSLTPIVLTKTTTSTDDPVLTPKPTPTSVITSIFTSTGSNGTVVTITQVQINPTLSPNSNADSANSTFFSNTGAVVGTFVLVGLTAAIILLWILFYVRRRRRRRQLEYDSAVSATLAAAGLYRSPVDDDDPRVGAKQPPYSASPDIDTNQRSGSRVAIATMHSQPSNGRASAFYDGPDPEGEVNNSFAEFGVSRQDGYMPARTSSPDAHYARGRQGSTSTGGFVKGHSANHSVGSYEPLLASYNRRPSNPSPPSPTVPLQILAPVTSPNATTTGLSDPITDTPRGNNDIRNIEDPDDRLDPGIRQRLEKGGDDASARELRDEEDYSRPVLQVRNLADSSSRES